MQTVQAYSSRANKPSLQWLKKGSKNLPHVMQQLGYKSFSMDGQKRGIQNVMMGRDSIVVLPTSGGKTAVHVVPALAIGLRVLIFSPLKALMQDQVVNIRRTGAQVAAVHSGVSNAENYSILQQWATGGLQFLLVAPERIHNKQFMDALAKCRPDIVAIDEAHVGSAWSDTFRPEYAQLGRVIERFNPPCVVALTATAPAEVIADLRRIYCMEYAELIVDMPTRHNLKLSSSDIPQESLPSRIRELLRENDTYPGIIYCPSRKMTEDLSKTLASYGNFSVDHYHAGMPDARRAAVMTDFMRGHTQVMCATNAFGMGINKAQPYTSKVLTPNGWVAMGDLDVGQKIIGSTGAPEHVFAIQERGVLPAFHLVFTDATRVTCSDDHLWLVSGRGKTAVLETSEIRQMVEECGITDLQVPTLDPDVPFRTISRILPAGERRMRCITVSAKDGLYVTDNYTITHNSDIRFIIHAGQPGTLENLSQEIGRAGRDGKASLCHMFYTSYAEWIVEKLRKSSYPSVDQLKRAYYALHSLTQGTLSGIPSSVLSDHAFTGDAQTASSTLSVLMQYGCVEREDTFSSHYQLSGVSLDTLGTELPDTVGGIPKQKAERIFSVLKELAVPVPDMLGTYKVSAKFLHQKKTLGSVGELQTWLMQYATDHGFTLHPPTGVLYRVNRDLHIRDCDLDTWQRREQLSRDKVHAVQRYHMTPSAQKQKFLADYFAAQR